MSKGFMLYNTDIFRKDGKMDMNGVDGPDEKMASTEDGIRNYLESLMSLPFIGDFNVIILWCNRKDFPVWNVENGKKFEISKREIIVYKPDIIPEDIKNIVGQRMKNERRLYPVALISTSN